MIEALSFSTPHHGGTFAVFRNLHNGLIPYQIDLRWLSIEQAGARSVSKVHHEHLHSGASVSLESNDSRDRAKTLIDFILRNDVRLVLFHALSGVVETAVARYLPSHIRRVLMVHTISPAAYRAAGAIRDWVHAAIAVSPRIRRDLIKYHRFPPEWTFCIPNCIDIDSFLTTERPQSTPVLRVLSHGRLDDTSKGILWIPSIVRRALDDGTDLHLSVSGEGKDLDTLKERIERAGVTARVMFLGATDYRDVPALVVRHDVFLFPSRFEGLGVALVEAMAGGCVPVASRISGVTDFVVDHDINGLLFPVGDVKSAALYLTRLGRHRDQLDRLSVHARQSVIRSFTLDRQCSDFSSVIRQVLGLPRPLQQPLSLDRWRIPSGLRPAWWHPLPQPAKNFLRKHWERWVVRS